MKGRKYKIIYADPPWHYNARTQKGTKFGRGVHGHYPTMTLNEIKAIPVHSISDQDCMLFLWVTFPRLKEGLAVIESWGFTYKTLGFSWIKLNRKNGRPFFGIGYYTKSNCELCLLAVKGRPFKVSDSVSSVVIEPRARHSEKPAIVRDRIVELCGDVPRVELFARKRVPGWDTWGNELANDIRL